MVIVDAVVHPWNMSPENQNPDAQAQIDAVHASHRLSVDAALLPAFLVGELKRAFEIGFLLFLPFLVIDMVVASVLMSMGMMMLSPVIISLPFKLMLFVVVDGWNLLIGSLVRSFQV